MLVSGNGWEAWGGKEKSLRPGMSGFMALWEEGRPERIESFGDQHGSQHPRVQHSAIGMQASSTNSGLRHFLHSRIAFPKKAPIPAMEDNDEDSILVQLPDLYGGWSRLNLFQ